MYDLPLLHFQLYDMLDRTSPFHLFYRYVILLLAFIKGICCQKIRRIVSFHVGSKMLYATLELLIWLMIFTDYSILALFCRCMICGWKCLSFCWLFHYSLIFHSLIFYKALNEEANAQARMAISLAGKTWDDFLFTFLAIASISSFITIRMFSGADGQVEEERVVQLAWNCSTC